jgi:SpoIID/LytB domain protein
MTIRRLATRGLVPLAAFAVLGAGLLMASEGSGEQDVSGTPAVVHDVNVPRLAPKDRPAAPPVEDDDHATEDDTQDEAEHDHVSAAADTVVAELPRRELDTFSMLGVTWKSGLQVGETRVQARWRTDGTWTAWTEMDIEPSEQGVPGTEPIWVDEADAAAVRVISTDDAQPEGVALSTIDPGSMPTVTTAASFATASSGVPQPSIISRASWGASSKGSCDSPVYGDATLGVVIHHTAGSNSYSKSQSASIVKATQAYHQNSRKWCDIGYNFLVDKYGQIFEGRRGGITKSVRGAHSGNGPVNEETVGISMMGTFDTTTPSAAMKSSVVDLAAWRMDLAGLPAKGTYKLGGLTLNRIAGHRNVVGTECPGAKAYAWLSQSGGLRDRVEDTLAAGSKPALDTPTGLKVTSSTLSSLSFDWGDVGGAEKYHVKVSRSQSMSSPVYGKFYESKGTVTGLEPGTTYYASVVVVDPDRNVRLSDYSGTPYPSGTTPKSSTPTGLKVTSSTSSSLTFGWNEVGGAEKYHVKVSRSSSMSGATYGKFTENKGTVTGLEPGTKYYYSVVVVDPVRNVRLSSYTSPASSSTASPSNGSALPSPTGLKVTASAPTSLSFGWNAVPGARKYHVKVSRSSSMSSATYGKFYDTKGTITGLKAGTKYYVAIVVVDPDTNTRASEYTDPIAVTTPSQNPGDMEFAPPTGLEVTSATASSLTFGWNAVPGAKKYHVKLSKSASMSNAVYGRFTESKGTVTGLDPSTRYYVAIVVVDPSNTTRASVYTDPITATTSPKVASGASLPAPSGLKVMASTPTSLTFDWTPVTGAKRYHVKLSTSSKMTSPVYGIFTDDPGRITGLKAGTKYYAAIVVVDPDTLKRASDYTSPIAVSTPPANPGGKEFAPPTGLKVSDSTQTSLSFAWDDVSGAEKYHVKLSKSASMSSATYGKFYENKGTISGLSAGTKYYAAIVVVDPSDNSRASEYTSPIAVTTAAAYPGGKPFPPPSGLKVTSSTETSLTFGWDAVPGAKKYHVKLSKSASMSSATYGKFYENKGTISGLSAGTKYYAAIVVVDPSDNSRASEYTSPITVSTGNPGGLPFAPPTNLKATGATATSLSYSWDAVSGAKEYHVKLSTSTSMSSPIYGSFTTNKGTVTGLKAGTKYYAAIVVVDPSDNSRASEYSGAPYPSASTTGASSSASNSVTVGSSSTVSFKGHGYGHGIGMSQYGAEGAARDGKSYSAILSHYYPGTSLASKSGDIRVLISADTTDGVLIKAQSGLKVEDLSGKRTISLPTSIGGKAVERWEIVRTEASATRSKLIYRTSGNYTNFEYQGSALTWSGDGQFTGPSTMSLILPNGVTMKARGDLRSAKPSSGSSARNTVNVLPLDDYVKGVIPAEMPSSWHAEALKAQAVAARTYGVRSLDSSRYYDICSTTSCQVYGGASREVSSTNSAVSATAGKILTYKGAPALAQFSSSSGGYTNAGSQPYLKAVDDPWDDWSGNANHDWTNAVKVSTIEKAYTSIGSLKSLQVTQRNGNGDMGGRVSSVKLVGSKGSKTISGVDARWAFGLRSDWFGF